METRRIISALLCLSLIIGPSGFASGSGQPGIYGCLTGAQFASAPDVFRPLHLRFLSYDALNNDFKLLLDKGSLKNPGGKEVEKTTGQLLDYFFIGINLPNDSFWVNLRPDGESTIIDSRLARTDMGRIMLASDLQLKKDIARFTSPETPTGKEYRDRLYRKAEELFGSDNITVPAVTRPWIVPDEIIVRETQDSAYIYKATLKIMLEQDYVKDSAAYDFKDNRLKELNEYSSRLIREIIVPRLTKEINSSRRYAALRQVYYSLIMAQWFKARFTGEDGFYPRMIDSGTVLPSFYSKEAWSVSDYFQAYRKSFRDGEFSSQEQMYTFRGRKIWNCVSGGEVFNLGRMPGMGEVARNPETGAVISSIPAAMPLAVNSAELIKVKAGATETAEKKKAVPHSGINSYIRDNLPTDLKGDSTVINTYRQVSGYGVSARIIPVGGICEATGQFAHIGLGQVYSQPVMYVDSMLAGEEEQAVIEHELYEISKWEALRMQLKLAPARMRGWILNNYARARELDETYHSQAPSIGQLTAKYHPRVDWSNVERISAMYGDGEHDVNLAAKRGEPAEGFRTFRDYCSSVIGKDFSKLQELELFTLWPLYVFEVDSLFAEASDYRQAYRDFYENNARLFPEGRAKTGSAKAYVPVIRKPFSTVKEIKDIINVPYEWSIDLFPEPDKWKGPRLYGFVLCVMDDGQLHMSLYDWNGTIREFESDRETEEALRTIGVIGDEGMLILVRSSRDEWLKDSAILGAGSRIALGGHSHPKGAGVRPSETGRLGAPADVELVALRLSGLPEGYPVDDEVPPIAQRRQDVLGGSENGERDREAQQSGEPLSRPDEDMAKVLDAYARRLEDFADSREGKRSQMPFDELALYLDVLGAMYRETVGKYAGTGADHEYVHTERAEFAGELAHHPVFQAQARRLLEESFEGAFRVLAEQFPGSFLDYPSSLDEMLSIMTRLVQECSVHPGFRDIALEIINDPRTYGVKAMDKVQEAAAPAKSVKGILDAVVKKITGKESLPATRSRALVPADGAGNLPDFGAVSDSLVAAVKSGSSGLKDELKPGVEQVVRARAKRLLILADGCADDDPHLAEMALREYLRLLRMFGNRIDFYCAVTITDHKHIMASRDLRPVLVEVSRSIPDKEDRANMLTKVALQRIKEHDVRGTLDLLKEIGDATFGTFPFVVEQTMELLFSANTPDRGMIIQLERIIDGIPQRGSGHDDRKVELLVALGEKYAQLGMAIKAKVCYEKAWVASKRTRQPAVTRLEFLVPVMREKGLQFPLSRKEVMIQARVVAEAELLQDRLNGRPGIMIALAREHAFAREYDQAEECARFIKQHMDYPRDHYDHVYGAILEAAALYGDDAKAAYAASKMTNYVKDHFERAAGLLVEKGDYRRAMDFVGQAMGQGYLGSSSVGYWGSTQVRIASDILRRDHSQIAIAKQYLDEAVAQGFGSYDLEDMIGLLKEYPALDPGGEFALHILKGAFEHNFSFVPHHSHRIILRELREMIMARVGKTDPAMVSMTDVFGRADTMLPPGYFYVSLKDGGNAGRDDAPDAAKVNAPGGIDFRHLPIVTAALGDLGVAAGSVPVSESYRLNLESEWRSIENSVRAGMAPSAQRIKEYVQASCYGEDIDREKVISCISDILRAEEERCTPTDPLLKAILVALDSAGSPQQLKSVFTGVSP